MKVITFGVFDLFHFGHLQFLTNAKALGSQLTVGVCSDALVHRYKHTKPVISQEHRLEIVSAIRYVDEVFLETKPHLEGQYVDLYGAQILAIGEDWNQSTIDQMMNSCQAKPTIKMIPRASGISSRAIKDTIITSGRF